MELETKMSLKDAEALEHKQPVKKKAPTLYVIIYFKLAKGLLACILAVGLFFQSAETMPLEYQSFLSQPVVVKTFHYLRINPENKFFTRLATKIGAFTDAGVKEAAIGALLWSLFPLTEGIGMLFRVGWAGWLTIFESAFFVPVEAYKLLEEFTWFMAIVMVTNIIIVWYLYANRDLLFRHHHHHHRHPTAE
jgi:uncharacterized membrane protein (DUF2068 family)